MGLLITLGLGVFVLIGAAVAGLAKNEQRICMLSIAVAFGAIVALLVLDLIPHTLEGLEHLGWPATIIAMVLGFVALVLLDRFLPDSPASNNETHAHAHGSTLHISIAVVIALTVHNIIEGMSVYSVTLQSVSAALLLAFGIGIHNMPMGMIVYSGVRGESLPRRAGILSVAALSTFIGGLIMLALGTGADDRTVHFMIALTVGLLLYIVICELAPHVLKSKNWALTIGGIIIGAAIVCLGVYLAHMA